MKFFVESFHYNEAEKFKASFCGSSWLRKSLHLLRGGNYDIHPMKKTISLKNVRVHNLKGVDLEIGTHELIVFTGVSGSGKSSLAFDTLFVEGQRRYIESLSTFARRYLGDLAKPELDEAEGLSPTIAIEQKSAGKNPRSTVGTLTEIYDYLRVLFARIGVPHCPVSGEPVSPQSKERILKKIQNLPKGARILFLAPFAKGKKGEFKDDFQLFLRKGYMRARVDGSVVDLSEEIELDKNLTHDIEIVVDRLVVSDENASRITEATFAALELSGGTLLVYNQESKEETLYSTHAYSPKSGLSYSSLEPHVFSFNSPTGMCETCSGIGITQEFSLTKILDPDKSIAEDCCLIASSYQTVRYGNIYQNLANLYDFDVDTPWKDLPERAKKVFLYGTKKKWTPMHFVHPSRPASWTDYVQWRGVLHEAKKRYAEAKSDLYRKKMEAYMEMQVCPDCNGSRLRPYPAATEVGGKKIHEICSWPIGKILPFFQNLKLDETDFQIADELLKEITERLKFLLDVGLHYLNLDRTAPTLSGGEAQRVRLASQVGCGLVGVTYVLDEPSIGLHPRDNKKLIATLKHLRDLGNTVIVVEHDEETIWEADRVVDFGPGPGVLGGRILVNGSHEELLAHPESVTGAYLSGREKISIPKKRRKPGKEKIVLKEASHNNLKEITAKFPLGLMIGITGVSGSGKSSLISDTLYPALANTLHRAEHPIGAHKKIEGLEHIDKIIAIDQSPIGRTPRSNPSTYIKIFDEIRALFAQLPDSKARGYLPGRFSFNVREGSCPQCFGNGMLRIDMDFLEDQWVTCPSCKSKRFDHETLSIHYKGKNIHDVLEMTVKEASEFFGNIPSLKRKLDRVIEVGMGYIQLGQPSTTLSGGEAQRIKLAKELVRPGTGNTFYILDEPTTGLHFQDIKALLGVLHTLVEKGNTVLVIEHNMDVIKTVDWILDLGPEGGEEGGEIVAEGTPEQLAKQNTPTGAALKETLSPIVHEKKKKIQTDATPFTSISVRGAAQNNLKHLDLDIPREALTICTGPSGSGKSSLAFDTVYAEGQRRYIESLSPYARQFVRQMPKPKISQIEGLSPAIAIEQKAASGNPRSTVGTLTEIYDYLRILFAQAGTAYCPETGEKIEAITKQTVVDKILTFPQGEKITILAPIELQKNEKFEEICTRFRREGYVRIRVNETIYELDEEIPFNRRRINRIGLVIDRLKVDKKAESRLFEAVENAARISDEKILVVGEEEESFFNLAFTVLKTGKSYPPITPHTFSFNSAEGMCLDCQGLGYQYGADLTRNPAVMSLSVLGLLRIFWTTSHLPFFEKFLQEEGVDPKAPLHSLSIKHLQLLLGGSLEEKWIKTDQGFSFRWLGLQPILARAGKLAHSDIRTPLIPLLDEIDCISCHGSRIHPLARNVRLEGHSIASLCALPIGKALEFLHKLSLSPKTEKVLEEVLKQLKSRLEFLVEVGINYLSLDRRAPTLSNGEAQRIRLARQLGSSLTGVLYVLDEPTIGLHPHDNEKLNGALRKLKELGNTLLMVEHDPLTVATADYLLDFGPGAGTHGGYLTAKGNLAEILENPHSLTGNYLSGRETIPPPLKRRKAKGSLSFSDATIHNLKNLSFSLPLGILTCLSGVSGSGKSTLMHEVIKPYVEANLPKGAPFSKLIVIDQNPIGHTVRSDVGTYVDALPPLRSFYASLGKAQIKGLQPRNFSYNHKKGMCTHCWGLGYKKVERYFLPPVRITCDQCHGMRLNPVNLEVTYEGRNFGQLLEMTVEEVLAQFQMIPKVKRILDTLISVGLGYLKLGQEIASLSGGEAQRMKLSRELGKRTTAKTLYLLDEPTTGLHPEDIKKLLTLLHHLVDKGHTMLIIEHNTDVLSHADYMIDMGPGPGERGGKIIATGTPEDLSKNPKSITGNYLKKR
ncbi:MAG: UvrABC system protein A [Chlamydiae bacterium]|nr:UvrABC system protein A [Chlamydiota bacterium]